MKTIRHLILGAAALAAAFAIILPEPAEANSTVLCSPARGARRLVNPNTSNIYNLNAQGCAAFLLADVGWAQADGFTVGPNLFTSVTTDITANTTATNGKSPILPANAYIHNIIVVEKSGGAVTGGLDIGTTASGTDVVAAKTVNASSVNFIADSALSKRVFSTTATQQIFFTCHTNCTAGPSLDVTIIYSLF